MGRVADRMGRAAPNRISPAVPDRFSRTADLLVAFQFEVAGLRRPRCVCGGRQHRCQISLQFDLKPAVVGGGAPAAANRVRRHPPSADVRTMASIRPHMTSAASVRVSGCSSARVRSVTFSRRAQPSLGGGAVAVRSRFRASPQVWSCGLPAHPTPPSGPGRVPSIANVRRWFRAGVRSPGRFRFSFSADTSSGGGCSRT